MTEGQLSQLQNEILRASFDAEQKVQACRLRLAIIGQHLQDIGRAFQEHPEEINPLPEPTSAYDYRKEIAVLRDGENAIQLCKELRALIQTAKAAKMREGMFKSGPFVSSDSGA